MSRGLFAATVAAALAFCLAAAAPRPVPPSGTHEVEIRGFAFSPSRLEVTEGDTVVWVNRDLVPHTATDGAGEWDSGQLKAGERWSWVATGTGELAYLCAYHPGMRGVVTVRAESGGGTRSLRLED